MSLLGGLAWAIAAAQAAAALPFLTEVAAGLPRGAPPAGGEIGPIPRTTVLMPAHDEAAHLGATLATLAAVLPEGMRVLVVADNCTDDTAAVARAAGMAVVERRDPARRGKGFALAFGRDHLAADPPEAVIVLDADCRPDPGALARLAAETARSGRAVQGLNLFQPDLAAPAMVQVSNFAFAVKNLLRQRGLRRLGAPVPLSGTGMAFPWAAFRDAPLATEHLAEDLMLSVELALAGTPSRFHEQAVVWSDAASAAATVGQRARWEGGFVQTARTHGTRLLAAGLRRGRPSLAWMGLHVSTAPLALLMMAELAATFVTAILSRLAWSHAAILSLGVVGALVVTILAAWAAHGWRWLRLGALLRLPFYLLWKLPIYARLLTGRGPNSWVRTERGP